MRICVDCECEVVAEPMCFVCKCGVAFVIEVRSMRPGHILVKPEIGLPLPDTAPITYLGSPVRLVA